MNVSRPEIVRSYRQLYRHGLHAVQYSAPARYTLKILLENAYRTGNAADYDAQKISNTLTFLEGAAKEKGLEHKILKNLLHTWYWEVSHTRRRQYTAKEVNVRAGLSQATVQHFEMTLKMFNETMGMCLPTTLTLKRESRALNLSKETTIP